MERKVLCKVDLVTFLFLFSHLALVYFVYLFLLFTGISLQTLFQGLH